MYGEATGSRRHGLIEQVAAQMREHVVRGDWPVGSRIPTEPELAALAGVGRNTVREAVQSLVHAGLLARRQGSGTYVVATSELPAVVSRHVAGGNQRDVLEVRQALEQMTAFLAARRRTDEQVAQLKELQAARAAAVAAEELEDMVATDMALHRYIAQIAGNPLLLELFNTMLDAVEDNIRFNFRRLGATAPGHESLVDAIEQGAGGEAARSIDGYLQIMVDSLKDSE
ncbi:MAG: FadR family transcriptional regulator [Bifidobacteriaceae bacterium]|jgi:DNA-binding FadR family transcriptional regulator|nr:FadR family transcriptional regulator [Bifidobacteriaceae bacterium]